ncbi:hypothetical protein KFE25_013109 [Diacronema lutheri]|uniref:Histone RNA hairpin-binding protein RNA-binding domain-containing protein n=1 Tax=Diacronema lutheri TaxID=2081491 RepID=A0A8J5XGN2_DIALT|nr:hypothetical protein KFE25_013109 [Diacronema lutheri]
MPKDSASANAERNLVYGAAREAVAAKKGEAPIGSREADPHKLSQRLKQVEYGYNTLGYTNYLKAVPKQQRTAAQPRTPDRTKVMSKRAWEGLIRKWRRELHKWDPMELQGVKGDGGAAARARTGEDAAGEDAADGAADAASVATTRGAARATASDDDDDGLIACRPPSDDEDDGPGPMSVVTTPAKAAPPARAARAAADDEPAAGPGASKGAAGTAAGSTPASDPPCDLNHDCYADFTPDSHG